MVNKFGALIVAGGSGLRFGTSVPKQFNEINGIPVIAHTLRKFENSHSVSEIVLAVHKDYIVYCNDLVKKFNFTKVTEIIEGGATRQQSVLKGLKTLKTEYALIHDSVRPLVLTEDIDRCCDVLLNNECCALGIKIADTIKLSDDGKYITSTINRDKLWAIGTPQCFKREEILKFHKNALFEGIEVTDDCMLAEHYGLKVRIVEAMANNMKITNYTDLSIAEVILDDQSRNGL